MRLCKIQEAKRVIDDLWLDNTIYKAFLIERDMVEDFTAWLDAYNKQYEEKHCEDATNRDN